MNGTTAKLTRMELLNTKKRVKLAKRGHKLLKDRRDELMKHFLTLIKENKLRREELEEELVQFYKTLMYVRAMMSREELENAFFYPVVEATVAYSSKSVVGVDVPGLKLNPVRLDVGYSLAQTPIELDKVIMNFYRILQELIALAEIEKSSEILAAEIEKTRRRVNALEHILIPHLERKTRYIEMKLEEMERANFCNLMRIKDIVRSRGE